MVVIENLDSLKAWLVKRLTPMCDADPNALAKYVVALVKKDKSEEDLRKLCTDQLEVFLQTQTGSFVTDLFEVLKHKNYNNDPGDTTSAIKEKDDAEEQKDQPKRLKRRLNRPSPIRHRSRSPYDRRRRIKRSRSPRDRRRRSYRSHSGSPKRGRISPKRRSPNRRSRSRSPHRRGRRARSLSSSRSRSSSRSPDASNLKSLSSEDRAEMKKKRCLDYDLKGFCMRGDNCPYDHGKDPVVVEDSAINSTNRPVVGPPKITPITAPPPLVPPIKPVPPVMPPPFLPPGIPVPPPVMRLPMHPHVPPPPPGTIRIPPPSMLHPPPRSQPPPGYNPEAPGLNYSVGRHQNVVSSAPPAIPTIGTNARSIITAPPPLRPHAVRPAVYNSAPQTQQNAGPRNHFNTNNSKLVIRKIPPALNNIAKLNEHFSKFGAINNIQVKFENDPQSALVEFAHVNSARAAKRDTGAVMNNRFIMVYWYNPQGASNGGSTNLQSRPSVKERLGNLPNPSQLKYTAPGKDTKASDQAESAVVMSGTIYRTISNNNSKATPNPAAPKMKENESVGEKERIETKSKIQKAQQATKEKLMARQKIMLQKKIELHKQKKELLNAQVAQQKLFLQRVKAASNPTEKKRLMETLMTLTASIDKLRSSLAGEAGYNPLDAKEKQQRAQKDLLDAELDLYNASTTGESTLDLKRKLNQLKMEASSLGIVNTYKGGWAGRGRGRGRYMPRPKVPRIFSSSANLDRRPREIRVSGFHEDEKDELISHLARFGEIETFAFGDDDITCTVKFQTRSQAEAASSHGCAFKNRRLIIVWTSGNTNTATTENSESAAPTDTSGSEENQKSSTVEQPLVVPADKDAEEDDDDDDENDNVNVHIGEVTSFTGDLDEDDDDHFEDELDEDALLDAEFDEDVGDEQDFDEEELRSWRR